MQVTSDVVVTVFLPHRFDCQRLLLFDFGLSSRTDRFIAFLAVEAQRCLYVWITITVVRQFDDFWCH